jgi:pimeloyl-ACP methyl ester carboxylesterase
MASPESPGMAVVQSAALTLAETQRRFEREAVPGTCDTGRYCCAYYTWGQGPPLIFIPGLSDDALSFMLVAGLLSAHFRCIAYNLPAGVGDGARLARYTHACLVADLFTLLDRLRVSQSYVFGSAFGSTIALAAMHKAPERLPRGIVQGGFARRPLGSAAGLLASFARYVPGRQGELPFREVILRRVHHGPFAGRDPGFWDYLVNRWGLPPFAALGRMSLLLHRLDLRPLLAEIRQPVLLVCGDRDPMVGKESERELLHGLPNAGRVELSGCGHNPIYSHPEVLAELVRRFLTPPPCKAC